MKNPGVEGSKRRQRKSLKEFSESVSFDRRLWKEDIEGSIAHAKMLHKQGIIDDKEAKSINRGSFGDIKRN